MDIVSHLRAISFFEHLEPHEYDELGAHFQLVKFVGGDDILKQGEPVECFFIVETGAVNMRHTDTGGHERPVDSKGPGEYFGIKMFTTQEPSDYTFEAVNAAEMWVLGRKEWDGAIEANPELIEHMPELRQEFARLTRGLDWLAPGEVIDLMQRRHWWALVLMMRWPAAIAGVFTILFLISASLGVTTQLSWIWPVYLVALFACLLWCLWAALDWWNDTFIVTNKRVVRINKVVFFSESRDELAIEKIQSQRVERGGPISVLLNISNLRITSAASDGTGVLFEQVGNVGKIQQVISGERMHVIERNRAVERERLRSQIAGEIRHYVFQQPSAAAPAKTETTKRARAPLLMPWQAWTRRPQTTTVKPKYTPKPVPLNKRLRDTWISLFGTEIRHGKVVTWRKNYFVLLEQIGLFLLVFFVVTALLVAITAAGDGLTFLNNGVYGAFGVVMLIAFLGVVWQWLDWRVDLYRLTETEIYDIESLPFGLRYRENKADLNKIQDVTYERVGIINTLLDFGNVITRVAGNAEPFTFLGITHPRIVSDEISERIEILKLRANERSTRENTRQIVDAIVAYHRLMMAERHQGLPVSPQPPPVETVPESEPEPPPLVPRTTYLETDGEFPSESDIR